MTNLMVLTGFPILAYIGYGNPELINDTGLPLPKRPYLLLALIFFSLIRETHFCILHVYYLLGTLSISNIVSYLRICDFSELCQISVQSAVWLSKGEIGVHTLIHREMPCKASACTYQPSV